MTSPKYAYVDIVCAGAAAWDCAEILEKRLRDAESRDGKTVPCRKIRGGSFKEAIALQEEAPIEEKKKGLLVVILETVVQGIETSGDGEPPEEALQLMRFLRKLEAKSLEGTPVAVLSLGTCPCANSTASLGELAFSVGVKAEKLLLKAGASKVVPTGKAQVNVEGPEVRVVPWIRSLLVASGVETAQKEGEAVGGSGNTQVTTAPASGKGGLGKGLSEAESGSSVSSIVALSGILLLCTCVSAFFLMKKRTK
uniref:Uncharacterized protein n=1 Tax=Chromera velia CCMP2878 TaxID=1169474 RepID=A0A0G4FTZ3_9ALVE|mmetsp:Transcript_18124/g.36761  ORF Transcript_18124/g.36761 Transcript_18124/m.36761 type:complete len:253 (+) Transcript_18124:260-1018(+)|eukprot:Cvel_18793.t1-p1 / transcript=Cvel_18793.t1 / gene=Cvel_18793 / organism=Chromera_velia_CCMP2878 / gene_product=hypothetical protein / transcript_product=hypothetical protein / location=Cvel_scaffold1578:25034-27162(+) / protein_length=252 / sequence_SO=supercontig / SO=protein_coding / is_pseudo=false